ncbi:MAG: 16S rRNA (adenine(1518)-N(6)/adenine(1519)-N(6))-dimethyltransferase RsmA [Gemmatimonadales bacterium]
MRARKLLGQHFLTDRSLLARIAEATGASSGDVVLEIGPGQGSLTDALLDTGAMVVAIERDDRMIAALTRRFAGKNFALIAGDALEFSWADVVAPWTARGMPWRVAGNIPYYITSPLLDRALSPPLPLSVTFLVQKEVADRVVAPAGHDDYGALSIGIQAVAVPTREFLIPAGAFRPPPRVDSAVLHLVPRADPLVEPARIAALRHLVTSLFSYRRKQMHRAVREALKCDAMQATAMLETAGIEPASRPEVVPVQGFIRLLDAVERTRDLERPDEHSPPVARRRVSG